MKSALVVSSTKDVGEDYEASFGLLIASVRSLSGVLGKECKILLQHSLNEDKMGILVECGPKHFGGVGMSFGEAVVEVIKEIQKVHPLKELSIEIPQSTHESAARKERGSGHRRKSPGGKRSHAFRKRRRPGQG